MSTTYKLNFDGQLLIIFLTLCGFGAAETYQNENDSCDFGKYKGICLRASNCLDLPVIAKEMGLKPIDVGRCGFTSTEEIICCPRFRQTTAHTPNKLPNTFTGFSNPFGNENFRKPQNINPNIFHGQERNSKIPIASGSDFADQRMNAIFNNNPVQSGNTIGGGTQRTGVIFNDNAGKNGNFLNENTATGVFRPTSPNEEYAQQLNAALDIGEPHNINPNLFHGQERNSKIPIASGSDFADQRTNAIFNNNPVQSGNTIGEGTQRTGVIFNDNAGKNGNFLNENTANGVFRPTSPNEEYAQQLNAALDIGEPHNINPNLFHGQERNSKIPIASGSDFADQRMNAIFNNNPVQSGNTIGEGTQRTGVIFNDNAGKNGNFLNENTANGVFRPTSPNEEYARQLSAALDIGEPQNINPNLFHGQERNSKIPIASGSDFADQRMNAIFNNNPVQSGNTIGGGTQRTGVIFNDNAGKNGNFLNENTANGVFRPTSPNEEYARQLSAALDIGEPQNINPNLFHGQERNSKIPIASGSDFADQRTNAIFNNNPVQSGNTIGEGTQRTGVIFNDNAAQNGNFLNENTATGVFRPTSPNEEYARQLSAALDIGEPQNINPNLFHGQERNSKIPIASGSDFADQRMNAIFNNNPVQSGNTIGEGTQRTGVIFNDNAAQNGNFLNENTATGVFRPTSANEEYARQLSAALDIGEPLNINSNIFHSQERSSRILFPGSKLEN